MKSNIIKKNNLIMYFVFSYSISYSLWIFSSVLNSSVLEILGRFGPLLSTFIIIYFNKNKKDLLEIFKKIHIKNIDIRWYIYSLLGPLLIILPSILINQVLSGIKPSYNNPKEWYLIIVAFIYVLFFSVLGEEIGWRGFALPRLLKIHNPLISSIILGSLWGFWHLPLFFIEGEFHNSIPFFIFILDNIALSIIMTWMYKNTKGNLLIAHFFHTSTNVTLGVLPILPMDTNNDMGALYIAFAILIVVTIIIVFTNKRFFYKKPYKKGKLLSKS